MTIKAICEKAIERVDEAIAKHERGVPEDLSVAMPHVVREELTRMRDACNVHVFCPGYARFVMDWPDDHGLVEYLVEVSYSYKRYAR